MTWVYSFRAGVIIKAKRLCGPDKLKRLTSLTTIAQIKESVVFKTSVATSWGCLSCRIHGMSYCCVTQYLTIVVSYCYLIFYFFTHCCRLASSLPSFVRLPIFFSFVNLFPSHNLISFLVPPAHVLGVLSMYRCGASFVTTAHSNWFDSRKNLFFVWMARGFCQVATEERWQSFEIYIVLICRKGQICLPRPRLIVLLVMDSHTLHQYWGQFTVSLDL